MQTWVLTPNRRIERVNPKSQSGAGKRRRYYLVTRRSKDIFDIADEVYGCRALAGRILQANPGVHRLCAGMALRLPEELPQRPPTADQIMRLDFAGLSGRANEVQTEG
jgi:hypothetical protein